MSLAHKYALLTGASKGLGLAIAQALLKEDTRVINWSRSRPAWNHDAFTHISCDCGKAEAVQKAWEKTQSFLLEKQQKSVDIFIYNTGILYHGPLKDLKITEWERLMSVNLHGVFYSLRYVIEAMQKQRKGHIVLIGSVAGLRGITQFSAYCASKFALRGLAEALMLELREYRIKVSYLAPGGIHTDIFRNLKSYTPNQNLMQPSWVADSVVHILKSPDNYLPASLEVRPLWPH